jgi:hypothetical protein
MLHHGVLIAYFYQGLELVKHEQKLALEILAPAKKLQSLNQRNMRLMRIV